MGKEEDSSSTPTHQELGLSSSHPTHVPVVHTLLAFLGSESRPLRGVCLCSDQKALSSGTTTISTPQTKSKIYP